VEEVMTFDVPLGLPRFVVTFDAVGGGDSMSFGYKQKLLLCPEIENHFCVRLLKSPDYRRFSIVDSI
jgi:hypothetical protein